jgi:hypothetical protein
VVSIPFLQEFLSPLLGKTYYLDEFKRNEVVPIKLMKKQSNKENQETPDQWAEMAGFLIDKFVGKNMSMTYDFDNLSIDIPKAQGPEGNRIGSAQWIINGKIIITTETYDKGIRQ